MSEVQAALNDYWEDSFFLKINCSPFDGVPSLHRGFHVYYADKGNVINHSMLWVLVLHLFTHLGTRGLTFALSLLPRMSQTVLDHACIRFVQIPAQPTLELQTISSLGLALVDKSFHQTLLSCHYGKRPARPHIGHIQFFDGAYVKVRAATGGLIGDSQPCAVAYRISRTGFVDSRHIARLGVRDTALTIR